MNLSLILDVQQPFASLSFKASEALNLSLASHPIGELFVGLNVDISSKQDLLPMTKRLSNRNLTFDLPEAKDELSADVLSSLSYSPGLSPAYTPSTLINRGFVKYCHDLKNYLNPLISGNSKDPLFSDIAHLIQDLGINLNESFASQLAALSQKSKEFYSELVGLEKGKDRYTREVIDGIQQAHYGKFLEISRELDGILMDLGINITFIKELAVDDDLSPSLQPHSAAYMNSGNESVSPGDTSTANVSIGRVMGDNISVASAADNISVASAADNISVGSTRIFQRPSDITLEEKSTPQEIEAEIQSIRSSLDRAKK